tara:strand:+ start:3055 stop:5223 length:2169 start_codon:yes stop_codon:yes gene_type:complete
MANYNIDSGFLDTQDNLGEFANKYSGVDVGPYIGIVKNTIDPLRMGRLGVLLPEMSHVPETSKDARNVIWCQYLSPFYGVKPFESVSKTDPFSPQLNQTSYGLWAIPPDIGTNVLVIFAKGEKNQSSAFWIGCVQEPLTNHMIPGHGATKNTSKAAEAHEGAETSKIATYGTDFLPALEKNKKKYKPGENIGSLYKWKLPINEELADQLQIQGLIIDNVRGTTTSSARRESPSAVFGMNTPGRIKKNSRKPNIGLEGTPVSVDRHSGHCFVMDDGAVDTRNQLIRLRTASGHQLLMHDTEGVVYIANGSGKSWLEMSSDGKVSIYAQDGFNFRSDGNFDLHAGGDINFHAKNNIKFTAEKTLVNNAKQVFNIGQYGIRSASQEGAITTYASSGISSYTEGGQAHGAGGEFHLAGKEVHFNSTFADEEWGPKWLTPEGAFIVTDDSQNDVNITVGAGRILEANTKKTKTTVPNLVTHEPFTRAPSAVAENVSQWEDKEKWEKLMKTEGTLEWMAQKNRESDIEYISQLQFIADAKKYVEDKGKIDLKNINLSKAKELSDRFTEKYNEIYKVKSVIKNLSKDNLKQVLVNKVVAGRITSVVSNLKGIVLGRTSANNLPPSMRGAMQGQLMQVGAALKGHATTAFKAIGSFFSGFKFSDIRLKEDIQLIGKSQSGINIYRFKYKHTDGIYQGVMAQEVPQAREMTNIGFYMVDYSKLDVEFRRLN